METKYSTSITMMLLNEPVVFLLLILITVIVVGQVTVGAFSVAPTIEGLGEPKTEDATAQSLITSATINMAVGSNQSSVDALFDNLQERCNGIKRRIDTINQKIPRAINDIRVKSVAYVPWEAKESSMIQIDRVPYQITTVAGSGMDCSCNYGCKWDIVLTLPIGPSGKKGPQGPLGPKGNNGNIGKPGDPGARGNWAQAAS